MIPPAVLRWQPLATKYALGVSANEILAIIWSESTGDPDAVNPLLPATPKDFGLMQVELPTANDYGLATAEDLFDPEKNIAFGSRYLASLKRHFEPLNPNTLPDGSPNPHGWVGSYNMGPGNFLREKTDLAYVSRFLENLVELETESDA